MQCRRRDIRSLQRQSVNLHQELTALKVGEIDLRKAIDGKPLVFGRIRDRKQKATSVREEKSWVVRISKLISEQRQFGFLVALDLAPKPIHFLRFALSDIGCYLTRRKAVDRLY